jgi:hypothetical protein
MSHPPEVAQIPHLHRLAYKPMPNQNGEGRPLLRCGRRPRLRAPGLVHCFLFKLGSSSLFLHLIRGLRKNREGEKDYLVGRRQDLAEEGCRGGGGGGLDCPPSGLFRTWKSLLSPEENMRRFIEEQFRVHGVDLSVHS